MFPAGLPEEGAGLKGHVGIIRHRKVEGVFQVEKNNVCKSRRCGSSHMREA